jgi:hypothetical protein
VPTHTCSVPEPPPRYDPDELINAWLAQSDAHEHAHNVERFARYAPELGWRSILAILELPDAQSHLPRLANTLGMLISQYGSEFIDRIMAEASVSDPFRRCLAGVHADPRFPIPESLWPQLSRAAGAPVGPIAPRVASLFAEIPDLGRLLAWTRTRSLPRTAPALGPAELRVQAEGWLAYHQSFWAWEELKRVHAEDGWRAAWPLVLALVARASQRALGAIGAGILEDMLDEHGDEIIERVEAQAAADPRFRYCLSHVWPGGMPDALWERVVRARGEEPQRG